MDPLLSSFVGSIINNTLRTGIGNAVAILKFGYTKVTTLGEVVGLLRTRLQASTATFPVASVVIDEIYVSRPDYEVPISSFLNRPIAAANDYLILIGARGVGKTTLVYHVTKKMQGTVLVTVTDSDTRGAIIRKFLTACGIGGIEDDESNEKAVLAALEDELAKQNPIKIIFEVESGNSHSTREMLKNLSLLAKRFSSFANVLIILGSNSSPLFPSDPYRQTVVFMEDIKFSETLTYLTQRKFPIYYPSLMFVANTSGFRAMTLNSFSDSLVKHYANIKSQVPITNASAQYNSTSFVDKLITIAESDIVEFSLIPILAKIQDKLKENNLLDIKARQEEYREEFKKGEKMIRSFDDPQTKLTGVNKSIFYGEKYNGVLLSVPSEVFAYVANTNAVVFNPITNEYQMSSRAHETALISFEISYWRYD